MFIDESEINDSNEDNLCFSFIDKTHTHTHSKFATRVRRLSVIQIQSIDTSSHSMYIDENRYMMFIHIHNTLQRLSIFTYT